MSGEGGRCGGRGGVLVACVGMFVVSVLVWVFAGG